MNFLKIQIDPKRIYGLDILRAIAILFVLLAHGAVLLPSELGRLHSYFVLEGVTIFFVLSGFLIGGILIKTVEQKEASLKVLLRFWKRRWYRTLPNYFLILFIVSICSLFTNIKFPGLDILEYVIFSQNLISSHPSFFPEAWSLSIEEWFYLIVPALIFWLILVFHIEPKKSILISAITILLFVLLIRIQRYISLDIESIYQWDKLLRKQVITRLDSLMFGVIGSFIQYYYPHKWLKNKRSLLIIGIFLFAANKYLSISVAITGPYMCVISFTVTSLGTLLLLPYLSNLKSGSGIIYRGITIISLISYSMYLLNLSIVQMVMINELIPWNMIPESVHLIQFLKYLTFWTFTILGSMILYKYFEIPMTNLRDKK